MGSPQGPHVMMPTPGHPTQRYGIGAVHDHTGETVGLLRRRNRRTESAAWLHARREKPPEETVSVAWDKATTHEDEEGDAGVRGAAGRLVRLYLPTDRPWLNPLETLRRHCRREVTHGARFDRIKALIAAAQECCVRYNQHPKRVLSIIGAIPKELSVCT